MARVRWSNAKLPGYVHSMWSNTEDWQYIRKTPELVSIFDTVGEEIVSELNAELRAAQARRKQPVEDGYKFAISHDRDRIRMRIWAFTARAAAHEAAHQSILKHMRFIGDVKAGTGGRTNPNAGRRSSGRTTGSRGRPRGGRTSTRSDPKREATLRRRLAATDALAAENSGATEHERRAAKERSRRLRSELGE